MKRTYGLKRDRVKVLDHQDIFLNCDKKESLFEALSIQNIKQYKREATCLGSSRQFNTPIRGVRKRKRVVKTLNISNVNEMIQESRSTYLTPDKSIHVRREEDLFDKLKDLNSISQNSRDVNTPDPFDILIPRRSPDKKNNILRPKPKVEYNKSSDTDCSSKDNSTIPKENVLQHELLIEKSNKNTYNNSDSINKLVNNASLLAKFTNSSRNTTGANILLNSSTDKENNLNYSHNLESKEDNVSSKGNTYRPKVILRTINVKNRLTQCRILNKDSPLTSTPLNKKKMETSLHNFSPILLNDLSAENSFKTKSLSRENLGGTNNINDLKSTNVAYQKNPPHSPKVNEDRYSVKENNVNEKSFLTVQDSMYDTCNSFDSLNSDDSKSAPCKKKSNSDKKVNDIVEDLTNLSLSETNKQNTIEPLSSAEGSEKQCKVVDKNLINSEKASEIQHSLGKNVPKVNVTRLRRSMLEKHLSKKAEKSPKLKPTNTENKDKALVVQLTRLNMSLNEDLGYSSTKLKQSKQHSENDSKKLSEALQIIDPYKITNEKINEIDDETRQRKYFLEQYSTKNTCSEVKETDQNNSEINISMTKATPSAHHIKSNLETINECVCANQGLANNNLNIHEKISDSQHLLDKKVPRVNVTRLRKSILEKYFSKKSGRSTKFKHKHIEEEDEGGVAKVTGSCIGNQNINDNLCYSSTKFKQSKNNNESIQSKNCEGLQNINSYKMINEKNPKVNVTRLRKSIVEQYSAKGFGSEVKDNNQHSYQENISSASGDKCGCDDDKNDLVSVRSPIINKSEYLEAQDEINTLELNDSNKQVGMTGDIDILDETLRETDNKLNHKLDNVSPEPGIYKPRETLVPNNSDDVDTAESLNVSVFVTKRRKNYANDDTLFIPFVDSDDENKNEPNASGVPNMGGAEMMATYSHCIPDTTNKSDLDIYDDSGLSKSPIIGSSMKKKPTKNKNTKKKVSVKESGTDMSLTNCSNIVEHNELARPIVLLPGKKWERSLSIYRRMTQMQNSCMETSLLDETAVRGRKYRESIQHFIKNQLPAATPTSLQLNDSALNRRSSVLGKPRRSTIRVVKDTSTSRSSIISSVTGIEDAFGGFISDDCDDTLIDLSRLSISDLENEITVLEKDVSHVNTARDFVLRRCNQSQVLPFSECYPDSVLKNCRKVGEGVYGEVFLYRGQNGRPRIMKIVPVAGDTIVNGEQQKSFHEIISEIIIAMELSALRTPIEEFEKKINIEGNISDFDFSTVEHATDTFNEVLAVRCVQGAYPARLLDLWELYDETHGSENDSPCALPDHQQYIVLELSNAGQDLESFVFNSAEQAHALFYQVAFALAVGEEAFQFEHRDLHWGNVLIAPTDQKYGVYVLRGRGHVVARRGVCATIIDYSLSRISFPLGAAHATQLYNNLADDESLFEAVGDYQFDVYRLMRQRTGNNWENFEPYTNILWLHYTLDKMITALRYKRTNTKIHKHYINKLKSLRDIILDYNSAVDFVLSTKQ